MRGLRHEREVLGKRPPLRRERLAERRQGALAVAGGEGPLDVRDEAVGHLRRALGHEDREQLLLAVEVLYTVRFETPASAAIASMVVAT